ncbi:E3 ubiquitin-protein ligase RNF114-like [Centruroides vittatus]|uniref:E3 ubiquitin-protein ligase RNF114-like n=1 Tax=Centruroides vittatus TaxID=120091 RepID=UPI00350E91CB
MAEEVDIFHVRCPICWDVYIDPVTLTCGHLYCETCIESVRKIWKVCPMCQTPISRIEKRDRRVKEVKKIMATHYAICHSCEETTLLSGLREHRTACEQLPKIQQEYTCWCENHSMCNVPKKDRTERTVKAPENKKKRGHSLICPKCALKKCD